MKRLLATVLIGLIATSCSSSKPSVAVDSAPATEPTSVAQAGTDTNTVRLLAYDSFTPPKDVFDDFTKETGVKVEVLLKGDTGTMLNTAILSKDTPIADVIWGVDSTFLSRAVDSNLLRPHGLKDLPLDPSLVPSKGADVVIPVDKSDVCINADTRQVPNGAGLTLDDLTNADNKGRLVVENPATSGPGMAFFLATVAKFGENGWQEYWKKLAANDVKVVSGWTEAWETEFSGAGAGKRPLVVSYSNSPAAFVLFGADPAATTTPIAIMEQSCIAVAEYAGLLANTENPNAAKLLDFLVSERFQRELATNLFVYPSRTGVAPPEIYTRLGVKPAAKPLTIDPAQVQAMRDVWIEEWTKIVLG
jgi:thiamine transport system substrate-binding protein